MKKINEKKFETDGGRAGERSNSGPGRRPDAEVTGGGNADVVLVAEPATTGWD